MKKISKTIFKQESGLTLVEVLASIVILSIVLLLFLLIFLQSMNTSKSSEEVITATYLAQTEMESVYEMSKEVPLHERKNYLNNKEYNHVGLENGWKAFEKTHKNASDNDKYIIRLLFQETENDMTRVLVQVNDYLDAKQKVQMENLYKWKVTENES